MGCVLAFRTISLGTSYNNKEQENIIENIDETKSQPVTFSFTAPTPIQVHAHGGLRSFELGMIVAFSAIVVILMVTTTSKLVSMTICFLILYIYVYLLFSEEISIFHSSHENCAV